MIDFEKIEDEIIIRYKPENDPSWIITKFNNNESISLNRVFHFEKKDLYTGSDPWQSYTQEAMLFVFANLENDYYRIKKSVLGIENELFIHKSIKFKIKLFKTWNNISIFKKIFKVIKTDLYIGLEDSDFPIEEFNKLLDLFPNSTEIIKYSNARIENILKEYVDTKKDFSLDYNSYMSKKSLGKSGDLVLNNTFAEYEVAKYQKVLEYLKDMLLNEKGYTESDWQKKILDILILIYPKYIYAFEEVNIYDSYDQKERRLDFMLVDSNGYVDVVEIKKPKLNSLLSTRTYRDNHVPIKELSGTIMQVEKYLFHLSKLGRKGEEKLTEKYKHRLPADFKINITNPNAFLILGREHGLSTQQFRDLEIIKRKYKNIVDIITYEDLIRRLERIIEKFQDQLS